jgi:DNA-binding transcriptional MerR regulator
LERLEQIIALKFLGVPLKQIKIVLDRPARALSETLRLQRRALEEKQELLSRAIRTIRVAEKAIERGKAADPAVLKRVIEVIDMQNDIEVMKKYYTEEAWEKHRRFYEEGPSREWQELYRDIKAVLGEDPAGPMAQTLADRWLKLAVRAYNGGPELQTDSPMAWMDREHWPQSMKPRIAEFDIENVNEFMRRAVFSSRKKYFSKEAWAKLVEIRKDPVRISAIWQSRVDLFREIDSSLRDDPASDR